DRKYGARRHDAAIELSLHRLETLDADAIVRRREGVLDKQARQIEKTGEPRHHRDDVQALYDQHGGAQSTSAAAAASAPAQRNTRRRRTLRAPRCARRRRWERVPASAVARCRSHASAEGHWRSTPVSWAFARSENRRRKTAASA